MTAITSAELTGVDQALAARVIAAARSIAPIDSLDYDSPARVDVVAILTGVARDAAQRGSALVTQQRIGPAQAQYAAASWFSDDDRAALRALCGVAAGAAAAPVGHFPAPGRLVTRIWPERYDS